MTTEHHHGEQPYWTDDRPLLRLPIGRSARLVRVRSHIAPERYRGLGSETLFPLAERSGERSYVQSHLYFYAPEESRREQRLADAQSWYYPAPADRALVLWELISSSWPWQPNPDPREDFIFRSLWLAYERLLVERFPDARQLFTTWEDTPYTRADWEGFLTTIGYRKSGEAAFSKEIR